MEVRLRWYARKGCDFESLHRWWRLVPNFYSAWTLKCPANDELLDVSSVEQYSQMVTDADWRMGRNSYWTGNGLARENHGMVCGDTVTGYGVAAPGCPLHVIASMGRPKYASLRWERSSIWLNDPIREIGCVLLLQFPTYSWTVGRTTRDQDKTTSSSVD